MDTAEYFRLKQSYETKLAKKKNQIRNDKMIGEREKRQKYEMLKRECVNCKKEGGTMFRLDKDNYYAKCAATPPCPLDVKIQRVTVSSFRDQENALDEKVKRIKNDIIETNMDNLYKFVDEDNTITRGESLKKELQSAVDELVLLRKGLERNLPQIDKLETLLQEEITELRAEDSKRAERYIANIRPVEDQLREAKYKYADVEQAENGESILVQKPQTLDDYYR